MIISQDLQRVIGRLKAGSIELAPDFKDRVTKNTCGFDFGTKADVKVGLKTVCDLGRGRSKV